MSLRPSEASLAVADMMHRAGARAVDQLRETHPHIDLQGLDAGDCQLVAGAVLDAALPMYWRVLQQELEDATQEVRRAAAQVLGATIDARQR